MPHFHQIVLELDEVIWPSGPKVENRGKQCDIDSGSFTKKLIIDDDEIMNDDDGAHKVHAKYIVFVVSLSSDMASPLQSTITSSSSASFSTFLSPQHFWAEKKTIFVCRLSQFTLTCLYTACGESSRDKKRRKYEDDETCVFRLLMCSVCRAGVCGRQKYFMWKVKTRKLLPFPFNASSPIRQHVGVYVFVFVPTCCSRPWMLWLMVSAAVAAHQMFAFGFVVIVHALISGKTISALWCLLTKKLLCTCVCVLCTCQTIHFLICSSLRSDLNNKWCQYSMHTNAHRTKCCAAAQFHTKD